MSDDSQGLNPAAPDPHPNRLGLVFDVITEAIDHGYSYQAAADAVVARLDGEEPTTVLAVAALLASLVAVDLSPQRPHRGLEVWVGELRFFLAMKGVGDGRC